METQQAMTADELVKRMVPSHLADLESTEMLKEKVEKTLEKPKEVDPEKDPRGRNPYTFAFNWKDSRGKPWLGNFTTHYPTPMDIIKAGVMQSTLTGSVPKESLDALTDEIAFIVSRCTFCLDKRPDWFKDPLNIVDGIPLMQAVYERVSDFEQFFRLNGKA